MQKPEFWIRMNNMDTREICPLCDSTLDAQIGAECFLADTWRAVCGECLMKHEPELGQVFEAHKKGEWLAVTDAHQFEGYHLDFIASLPPEWKDPGAAERSPAVIPLFDDNPHEQARAAVLGLKQKTGDTLESMRSTISTMEGQIAELEAALARDNTAELWGIVAHMKTPINELLNLPDEIPF